VIERSGRAPTGSRPLSCPYSPNRSPNSPSTCLSSSACSKAALASTLALVPACQAGVSLVRRSTKLVVYLACMAGNKHERPQIEQPELQWLFVNWLIYLLGEQYGVNGWGTSEASRWSITLADESTIQVEFDPSDRPDVQGPAEYEAALVSIVKDAYRRTLARDYGTGAWWMVACRTDMRMSGVGILHLMRLRKEYMPRQFQGDWQLGGEALVSFRQTNLSTSSPLPKFDVDIIFRVPGPGPFTMERAQERGRFCVRQLRLRRLHHFSGLRCLSQ
jgi:hypothetical protein